MSKLSFRARALDASKPMPIFLAEELPDLPEYSAINRAVPQMPSGMEKEEECEHHLQRAICTGLIIPTPEVCEVNDLEFYERCYPPDYKMPKQHIHMQPLWQEQEAPEYDIDSEDERWLKQQRHPELTELKFEQMMDKLERSSGQTVVTLKEAKLLLDRHDDLVIAVYDYWLNKRLNTQHPLILSVKTEGRPGQSTNNPYLAFRRRTEKMQTRKNIKNDESSYEKMLKLRRDLARALTLLELVAKREKTKRDLVKLTALLTERRYVAGDFASQLLPDPPPRPTFSTVHVSSSSSYRRDFQHYPPRAPSTPVEQPRSREKRPYKRRKHRHHAPGGAHGVRDSGVFTSSEEESGSRAEAATPPDDGPFAFRRKPGCYYEMPTTTLCGDPVDPESSTTQGFFEHEIDERNRFTLTSLRHPYPHCVGFARRRLGRGGRVIIDRVQTPLDDLWPKLPFTFPNSSSCRQEKEEEADLENNLHRSRKEITRDYHTSGKYPWRHAFRQHLARNPHLWVDETKTDADDFKIDVAAFKTDVDDYKPDVKTDVSDVKIEPMDIDLPHESESDISFTNRTIKDSEVRENLDRVIRKRAWSGCSDSSHDMDESLQPVEMEFEKFINEVSKKWLHFRPKTPSPSSPEQLEPNNSDHIQLTRDMPISVELRLAEEPSSVSQGTFTTSEFTLNELYPDLPAQDDSGASLDISGDDLLTDNFTGLTEDQVESILSGTDLKALADVDLVRDDKAKISDDLLEELVKGVDTKDPFLLQGQSSDGRAGSGPRRRWTDAFGSTSVVVTAPASEPLYIPTHRTQVEKPASPPRKVEAPKEAKKEKPPAEAAGAGPVVKATPVLTVPKHNSGDGTPTTQNVKVEKKRKDETIEEVQLAHGVQLKTVQTKHSPLKKHIITSSGPHRRATSDVTLLHSDVTHQPQIVTVAVSDSLKMRLQNHLVSNQAGATVVGVVQNVQGVVNVSGVHTQNGPFVQSPLTVAVPVQARDAAGTSTSGPCSVSSSTPRRTVGTLGTVSTVGLPLGVLHKPILHSPARQTHTNKLKVVGAATVGAGSAGSAATTATVGAGRAHAVLHHSRPLTNITQIPAVVSLATLGDGKSPNTALLKAAPGSVTQFFEIKSSQLGKGPHLVNVMRQPAPGKATVTRFDLNDSKKRQVVATFDGTTLKGNIATTTRPHRVSVSVDSRQVVKGAVPTAIGTIGGVGSVPGAITAVRAHHLRHQIHLKNTTLQVAPHHLHRAVSAVSAVTSVPDATSSITIPASQNTATIPSSVVANLLQKNAVQLPKGAQKISITAGGGGVGVGGLSGVGASVQAVAFTSAQLKAKQARLVQPAAVTEVVEATTTGPSSTSSKESSMDVVNDGDDAQNGGVRRRTADTLPMEVT